MKNRRFSEDLIPGRRLIRQTARIPETAMLRSLTFVFIGAAAAASVYYFSARKAHDSAWWADECERQELVSRLEIYRMRLAAMKKESLDDKVEAALEAKAEREAKLAGLERRADELRGAIASTELAFRAAHMERLQQARARVVGSEWPEFAAGDGRVFYDAKVIAVTDAGVSLRHRNGSVTVRYADLTEEQQVFFGQDEELSVAAQEAERRISSDYHSRVDKELGEIERSREIDEMIAKEERKLARKAVTKRAVPAWIPPVAQAPVRKPVLEITPLSAPARRVGPGRPIYSDSRPQTTIYYGATSGYAPRVYAGNYLPRGSYVPRGGNVVITPPAVVAPTVTQPCPNPSVP